MKQDFQGLANGTIEAGLSRIGKWNNLLSSVSHRQA
jgi:hypothetical protein